VGLTLWLGGSLDAAPDPISFSPRALGGELLQSVLLPPVFEEIAFRLLLCAALVPVVGRWPAVLLSSAVFGLAHYNNPGPTNLIAGLAFGWAFLVSESVLVPIAWHALGNLFVLLLNLAWLLA
jgi:membrane protease YdiL (CAAX protease family)